jgi:hypothetical protein
MRQGGECLSAPCHGLRRRRSFLGIEPNKHRTWHLGHVGIAVHHDLPGVGQNLQDHYIARISYAVHDVATVNKRSPAWHSPAKVRRYLVTGKGMLT